METLPLNLIGEDGRPRPFRLVAERASDLGERYGLVLQGVDTLLQGFSPLAQAKERGPGMLSYLGAEKYSPMLAGLTGVVVLTTEALRDLVPAGNSVLLVKGNPRDVFYTLMADAVDSGRFERLKSYVSPTARIHSSAIVSSNVYVSDDVEIGPNAVVLSNTYLGPGVLVKPNATIGGDGFEVASIAGRKRVVVHAGGVWLEEGVQIGSSCCIDKGVFGDFTYLGEQTCLDNLVHFAHSSTAGRACNFTACTEVSGSVHFGDGVWVGPNTSISNNLQIGSYSFIGIGAVVTRNLPPHSLAYGSPAKVAANVCMCRAKLSFEGNAAVCSQCGRSFLQGEGGIRFVAEAGKVVIGLPARE